jgi:hypothetical protein
VRQALSYRRLTKSVLDVVFYSLQRNPQLHPALLRFSATNEPPMHIYEVRPRIDHRGVDLISDALPFGRLWYDTPDNAIGYAMHSSRSHDAVIRVYVHG